MKLKIIIGVLAFLIVVNVATMGSFVYYRFKQEQKIEGLRRPAIPGLPGRSSEFRKGRRLARIHEEHREKLVGLFGEFHAETQSMRLRVHELQSESFLLMQKNPVPTIRVDSLLEEISAVQLDISKAATRKMIESRSFLSPEEMEMFFNAILGPSPGRHKGFSLRGPGGKGDRNKHFHRSDGDPRDSI